jgi:hypothetical protein
MNTYCTLLDIIFQWSDLQMCRPRDRHRPGPGPRPATPPASESGGSDWLAAAAAAADPRAAWRQWRGWSNTSVVDWPGGPAAGGPPWHPGRRKTGTRAGPGRPPDANRIADPAPGPRVFQVPPPRPRISGCTACSESPASPAQRPAPGPRPASAWARLPARVSGCTPASPEPEIIRVGV